MPCPNGDGAVIARVRAKAVSKRVSLAFMSRLLLEREG
jgi:hypothetical protein